MKRNNHGSAAVVIFVVAILAAVGITGFLVLSGTLSKINRTSGMSDVVASSDETFERDTSAADTIDAESVDFNDANIKAMKDDDVKNILLIGQDRREGQKRQRSDAMILCSINTKDKKIVLTSLMRDMYVEIPGYSPNKMNAAYAFGGMDLLDQVIEKNFGVTIDGNVEVDFDGFIKALTVVGDIPMELSAAEADYLNNGNWEDAGITDNKGNWTLEEGMNQLNPEQALCFSRIRYLGNSDWERTERQRRVIMAAFDKVKDSDLSTMLNVANSVFPYLTTDMTSNELLGYVKTISVDSISQVDSKRIPVDGYYTDETINGMSVLVPDLTMNSQFLQSYIYGTEVNENLALDPVSVDNDKDSSGSGSGQTGNSGYTSGNNNSSNYSGNTDYGTDYGDTGYQDNGGGYSDTDYSGDTYDSGSGDSGYSDYSGGGDSGSGYDAGGGYSDNGYSDADGDGYDDNTGAYIG